MGNSITIVEKNIAKVDIFKIQRPELPAFFAHPAPVSQPYRPLIADSIFSNKMTVCFRLPRRDSCAAAPAAVLSCSNLPPPAALPGAPWPPLFHPPSEYSLSPQHPHRNKKRSPAPSKRRGRKANKITPYDWKRRARRQNAKITDVM